MSTGLVPMARAFVDPTLGALGPMQEFPRPIGATLAELIDLVVLPNDALRPHLRVRLNGELIDPRLYRLIRPKSTAYITIAAPLAGGGNSDAGKILSSIAAIALIGASLYVGAFGLPMLGSFFAAGATGAQLVAGGLSIAASLMLQGLQLPPSGNATGSVAAREVGVASATNSFEPGAYLQRVIGTRRVAPQIVLPPYMEIDGDNQYVTVVYGLAGRHEIDQVRVGSAEVSTARDMVVEIREGSVGDAPLTLVTDTRIQTDLNIRLSEFQLVPGGTGPIYPDTSLPDYTPFWHRMETKEGPDIARVFLQFDSGLMQVKSGSSGTPAAAVTALRFRIRRKGVAIWSNLPEFVVRGYQSAGALRLQLDFEWRDAASIPAVTVFTENYGGWSWKYDTVVDPSSGGTYWTADPYFASKVDFISTQRLRIYLDTALFPPDRYEIEVRRGYTVEETLFTASTHAIFGGLAWSTIYSDFYTPSITIGNLAIRRSPLDFVQSASVLAIQSIWSEYPFDFADQPTTLIAIRARNRSISQVSVRATGYAEAWNGSAWVLQPTGQPAAWYREILEGDLNAEPVPASLVDEAGLIDWAEWTSRQGISVNAVLQGQTIEEALSIVAQAGLARPVYAAQYGVVIDRPRAAQGLITQRNAGRFAFSQAFAELPHALRVNLADEANDGTVREITVYADGYNLDGSDGLTEASRFESITYAGITSEWQARHRAKLDLRNARHRARTQTYEQDIEHLEHPIGTHVLVETDILGQIGGRARISAIDTAGGLVTALRLDEERDFTAADAGALPRAVAIRLRNGDLRYERVTGDDSDLARVVFATPFAMPVFAGGDLIVPGALVASGSLGQEAAHMLIWDIAPGRDLTADITAIPYAEGEVYELLIDEAGDLITDEDGDPIDTSDIPIILAIRDEHGDPILAGDGSYITEA